MAKDLESVEPEEEGKIELTDRELAIIDGKDPDFPEEDNNPVEDKGDPPAGDDPPPSREQPPSDEELAAEENEVDVSEEPEPEEGPEWVTDEVRSLAYSYGMSEDDLKTFGGVEDFERTGRLLDKRLTQQVELPQEQEEPRFSYAEWEQLMRQQGASQQQEPTPPGGQLADDTPGVTLDPKYYKDNDFDDDTMRIVETAAKTEQKVAQLEAYIAQQREAEQQRAYQQEINDFHSAVDRYKPEFFGETVTEKGEYVRLAPENQEKRTKLYNEVAKIAQGIHMSGQAMPTYDVLVRRAAGVAFAEDFAKEQQEQYASRIQKQSRRRRAVSGKAGSASPSKPQPQTVEDIVNDPEIESFWVNAQRENGVDYS